MSVNISEVSTETSQRWLGKLYAIIDICVNGVPYKAGDEILNADAGNREPMLKMGQAEIRDERSAETEPVTVTDRPAVAQSKPPDEGAGDSDTKITRRRK